MVLLPVRRALAAAAATLLVVAGCTDTQQAAQPLPPPPSTEARPPTTPPPDYTGVQLPAVDKGRVTTTTLLIGPGQANLNGTVLSPDGTPASSATVRVERLVGSGAATTELATGADGTWTLPGVLGGRYRVRAWRAPDLAAVRPAMVFVGATDTVPVEVKLERHFGVTPVISVAPNPPLAGAPASLAVQVSSRTVDGAGVVQGVPQAGAAVLLDGGTGWTVTGANPTLTDSAGRVRWEVVCRAAGAQGLRLLVGSQPFQLALPDCRPPPTTTTTVPGTPTTTRPGAVTTTTRPGATTTTRPPAVTTTTRRP